jgi:low affinity Fe/Cu permease
MKSKQTIQYLKELFFAVIMYVVILIVSVSLLRNYEFSRVWQIVIALSPALPVVFIVIILMRMLNNSDELQQRVNLLAVTFSAALTGLITFSYGILENIGFPKLPTLAVFPILFVLWGIGLGYFTTRYE